MTIPVIILNYNSYKNCRKCTSDLRRQTGVDIEIIIVDNNSRPDDLEQVRLLCEEEGYTLLESKSNGGYNAGNNIGLRYASGKGYEFALIANPDMEFPQMDYVSRISERIAEDPQIAVLGTNIHDAEGRHQNPLFFSSFWDEFAWPIDIIKYSILKIPPVAIDRLHGRYCSVLIGCCVLVRMSFIERIGFFDENVFLYCEEEILAYQARNVGVEFYYMPEVTAVHNHMKSEKGNKYRRMLLFCNSVNYKNKYHSNFNKLQIILLRGSNYLRKLLMKLLARVNEGR